MTVFFNNLPNMRFLLNDGVVLKRNDFFRGTYVIP